jgi:polyadenylate-binding protein
MPQGVRPQNGGPMGGGYNNQMAPRAGPGGMRPQMKYPVRPQQQQPPQQQQGNQLTAAALAQKSPAEQRQMIGERLYPMVMTNPAVQPKKEMAGKLTGMLLEMEVSELLHLLESPQALSDKLQEAIAVLENYLSAQNAAVAQQQQQ